MTTRIVSLACAVALVVSCRSHKPDVDQGGGSPTGGNGSAPAVIQPELAVPPISGPAVFLRPKNVSRSELVVELLGQGVHGIYGVAFRLKYDADTLRYRGFSAAPVWPADNIHLAAEKPPGQVIAVITAKGAYSALGPGPTVLGTLELDVLREAGTSLTFDQAASAVIDFEGRRAATTFQGGELRFVAR